MFTLEDFFMQKYLNCGYHNIVLGLLLHEEKKVPNGLKRMEKASC